MATLVYKKYTEVYEDLLRLMRELTQSGRFVLPSERDLAVLLKTSGMTLRKALHRAEMEGLIVRENRKTLIVDHGSDLANCGRILFVFVGDHGRSIHLSQERLYLKFCAEAKPRGADVHLLLLPSFLKPVNDKDLELYEEELSKARIVIFGIKDCNVFFDTRGEKILNTAKQDPKRIFLKLSMDGMDLCENAIMVDEFAMGECAAELLAGGGAKRPILPLGACLFTGEGSLRDSRLKAFCSVCRKYDIEPLLPVLEDTLSRRWFTHTAEILEEAWEKNRCDGAFLLSDLFLDVSLQKFFRDGLIPSRFQVVAAFASDIILPNTTPVSGIGHDTDPLLARLLQFLEDVSKGNSDGHIYCLIPPKFYPNQTILKEEDTWNSIINH